MKASRKEVTKQAARETWSGAAGRSVGLSGHANRYLLFRVLPPNYRVLRVGCTTPRHRRLGSALQPPLPLGDIRTQDNGVPSSTIARQ